MHAIVHATMLLPVLHGCTCYSSAVTAAAAQADRIHDDADGSTRGAVSAQQQAWSGLRPELIDQAA